MPLLSDFTGGDAVPARWKALDRLTLGSGTWTSTVSGYIRVHAQGPSGAGRRAPSNTLGGPGGGAGGRAVKVYKVAIGDQFPWTVGAGGATEGANGAAPTTFGTLVGNPGQGAVAGLTGTSFNTGGGAGGTATGGDINLQGGKGGDTAGAAATQPYYAHGACGGGAPHGELIGLVAGMPGNPGLSLTNTTNNPRRRPQRGGGEGGVTVSGTSTGNARAPGNGARGGGGGGGSGLATANPVTLAAHLFGAGDDGEVLIEIEDKLARPIPVGFAGYRSGHSVPAIPPNAYSQGQITLSSDRISLAYFEFEDDVLIDALYAQFTESAGFGASVRYAIYSAETRKLVATTGTLSIPANASTAVIGGALDMPFIRRGGYFLAVIQSAGTASMGAYNKAASTTGTSNGVFAVLHEYLRFFSPAHGLTLANSYSPTVISDVYFAGGSFPADLPESEIPGSTSYPFFTFVVR